MYGKIFGSLWEGSMIGQADAQLVFVFLIAHADFQGVVDLEHAYIAALTGLTVDRVRAALALLEAIDPRSRRPDDGGRRILRLDDHRDWGWTIVNHAFYMEKRDEEHRRHQNRAAKARSRARDNADRSAGVSVGQQASAKVL